MATETKDSGISPDVLADMQAVADALASRKPLDPVIARRVQERAEKARLQLLATHGVLDIGVQMVREIRGELPES